jgi:putative nucleotidyltransferase with HDIG domain
MNGNDMQAAKEIVMILRSEGHGAFIVGGAVRDMLLGREPKDVDVATSALPDDVARLFPDSKRVGESFGVALVEILGAKIEVATFRKDGQYSDGRRPDSVEFCGREEDAKRRDFTINAIFFDPIAEKFVDDVGGLQDLHDGIIKTVGNAHDRFQEDFLRMLRAVRFAARLDFKLDAETALAISLHAAESLSIAPERVRQELSRMFTGPHPSKALWMLHQVGLLQHLLPEVDAFFGVQQPPDWHPEGDVFIHTGMVLDRLAAPSETLAWAALLHDVGKPATFMIDETGRIRFNGHDEVGAKIAGDVMARLKFPNDVMSDVMEIIGLHNKMHYCADMRKSTIRKIVGNPLFPVMIELNRADSMSSAQITDGYVHFLDFIIAQDGVLKLPEPLINGRDLIGMGMVPGPHFGAILKRVYDAQLNGDIGDRESALALVSDPHGDV